MGESTVDNGPIEKEISATPELTQKFIKWTENAPKVPGARMARKMIWNAAKADLSPDTALFAPKKSVQRMTSKAFQYLEKTNPEPSLHEEDVEGDKSEIYTRFRKEENAWIAEEVRILPDKKEELISRARISKDGNTQLTLTYTDPVHAKNANPNIKDIENLPLAAVTTFNLLVDSTKTKT